MLPPLSLEPARNDVVACAADVSAFPHDHGVTARIHRDLRLICGSWVRVDQSRGTPGTATRVAIGRNVVRRQATLLPDGNGIAIRRRRNHGRECAYRIISLEG